MTVHPVPSRVTRAKFPARAVVAMVLLGSGLSFLLLAIVGVDQAVAYLPTMLAIVGVALGILALRKERGYSAITVLFKDKVPVKDIYMLFRGGEEYSPDRNGIFKIPSRHKKELGSIRRTADQRELAEVLISGKDFKIILDSSSGDNI